MSVRLRLRTLIVAIVTALVVALAVFAGVLLDSARAPYQAALVKVERAQGIDAGDPVIWVLALGSDARPGEAMTQARADAIQLIGINTDTGAATIIGVPRDSWVPIPGYGTERVNSSLYFGGPQLAARTVGDLVGVQPDYVFVTRFPFFEDLVDSIGGIDVVNPRPFADPYLKDDGFRSGRIHLRGYDAMAFSRIRKDLPGGDFDRSANQQRTLRGIQAKVRARADEPGFIAQGVLNVIKYTSTDVPPAELFKLAQAVATVEPGRVTTCVVPGSVGNVGAASVVFPDVGKARAWGAAARADATLRGC